MKQIVNTYKTDAVRHNGSFITRDDATDHHVTHTLHYGGWVFEWIRFYETEQGPKIFRLKEHIERLFYSAGAVWITMDYSVDEIMQACIQTVEKSGEKNWYIRPIVYHGQWSMSVYPDPEKVSVQTFISVWKRGKYLSNDPIHVKISHVRRIHPSTFDMKAKISWAYANSIQASLMIKKEGYHEWLLLDTEWYIAEGPGENIFFVKGDKVITPALGTILPGITRATQIQLLSEKYGITVVERLVSPDELKDFNQAFFVGTAAEVTPIWSITSEWWEKHTYAYADDSITMKLKHFYDEVVRGKVSEYEGWLW